MRTRRPTPPFPRPQLRYQRTSSTPRLDEIGTEEKLPLPEWEWDHSDSARMGGGGGGGQGGQARHRSSSDGSVGGGAGRGERSSSADSGRGGGGSVSGAKHVHARVSAEGRTRVLLISSHKDIRRTISTFGAKEASLVRQEWQGRLVLDKYLR